MKYLIFISGFLILLMLIGCRGEKQDGFPAHTGSLSTMNSSFEESSMASTEITSSDLIKTYDKFTSKYSSLDPEQVTKIEISVPKMPSTGETYYSTSDKELIEKWIKLLKKMKISARPFVGVSGVGYGLSLYINGEKKSLGGFMLPYIYMEKKTMCYLDNYDELMVEFDQLLKEIGYVKGS